MRHDFFSLLRAVTCVTCLAALGACSRDRAKAHASPAASASSAATVDPPGECLTHFDLLFPFQKYGDADLVRGIVVDGDQVYFRTYTEVYRVPLAGGTPVSMSTMAGGLMNSRTWVVGDKFVTQSPGEPIFMALPKSGGTWTTILDASTEKLGGGRSIPNRILHDIGKSTHSQAHPAVFDGSVFYWIQETTSKGATSWAVRRIALAGGSPTTLYESQAALSDLEKAGDRLMFFQKEPEPPKKKEKAPPAKAKGFSIPLVNGKPAALMSLSLAGGKPDVRVPKIDGSIAVADNATLYISGFLDGDITKGGIYRVAATGTSPPVATGIGSMMSAGGFTYGDRVALYGIGTLKPIVPGQVPESAKLILTAPRGGNLERAACIGPGYTTHAYAMAGKTMLVSVFRDEDRTAAIARIKLP
jgi:hypothetical protein